MGPVKSHESLKMEILSQAVVREMWGRTKDEREDTAGFEGGPRRPLAKECGQPPEAGKGEDADPHPEPPEGTQPCDNLDFGPLRPGSGFWTTEMYGNKHVLF